MATQIIRYNKRTLFILKRRYKSAVVTRPALRNRIPAFELPAPGKRPPPATKQKPPPVKRRPIALPQKGFNRPSRFSSKLPALHPHQIKETPRHLKNIRMLKWFLHFQYLCVCGGGDSKEFIMVEFQCLIVDMMKSCNCLRNHRQTANSNSE